MKNIHRDVIKAKQVRLNHVWAPIVCFCRCSTSMNESPRRDSFFCSPFSFGRQFASWTRWPFPDVSRSPARIHASRDQFNENKFYFSLVAKRYWKICFQMGVRRSANERLRLWQSWFNFWRKNTFSLEASRLVKRRCSINDLKLFL